MRSLSVLQDTFRAVSTRMGSAFVPVRDSAAADWYAGLFGLQVVAVQDHAAVLTDGAGGQVTYLAPASGIAAEPGLPWASCSYTVSDLPAMHAEAGRRGLHPSDVVGDPEICRFFTLADPDGNTVLVVDR